MREVLAFSVELFVGRLAGGSFWRLLVKIAKTTEFSKLEC